MMELYQQVKVHRLMIQYIHEILSKPADQYNDYPLKKKNPIQYISINKIKTSFFLYLLKHHRNV